MLSRAFNWLIPLTFTAAAAASPALPLLPPFDGSLTGELFVFGDAEAQKITWTLTASTPHSGQRVARLDAMGDGVRLAGVATVDTGSLAVSWRITSGLVELGAWFGPAATRHAPALTHLEVAGSLGITGQGSFNPQVNALAGELAISLREANVSDPAAEWSITGLSGLLTLPRLPGVSTGPRQRVAFKEARYKNHRFGTGLIEFQLESESAVSVQTARMEAFGGVLLFQPFRYDLGNGEFEAVAAVEGFQLAELQPFLADSVRAADGRLSGQLHVLWSAEGGLRFGEGHLTLTDDAKATIRLAKTPGFLSSKVPAEFDFLPWMPGFIRNRFKKPNPAHAALQRIELGEETLTVETLVAQLQEPDSQGNSKTLIQLVARPSSNATAEAVKTLRLNLNINAPLADIFRYGSDGRLSFGE